jgi:hypothetical protein
MRASRIDERDLYARHQYLLLHARERPPAVLDRLQKAVELQNTIVISVITSYEMLVCTVGRSASPHTPNSSKPLSHAFPQFCMGPQRGGGSHARQEGFGRHRNADRRQ